MSVPVAVEVSVVDTAIAAVEHNGFVWVSVRRVCEALDINTDNQREKLRMKPWACTEMISVRDAAGRVRDAFFVRLDSLPMWLATIDHTKVADSVVSRLIRFQREAHDALAAHFTGSGRTVPSTARVSGGASGSGAPATTVQSTVVGSGGLGGAAELLAMVKGLTGALEATLAETAIARTTAEEARAIAVETANTADEAQTLARVAMAHAERAAAKGIPATRRRSAQNHITRQMRAFCGRHGLDFKDFFAGVRRELGLRPRSDGGPALGKAPLSPEQVILMARYATNKGVPGCGARIIEDILTGLDEVARPGFIDMPTSAPKTVQ